MNRTIQLWRVAVCTLVLLTGTSRLWAQKTVVVPSRVTEAVDDTRTVTLKGNVHPLAQAANDHGVVPDSQPMSRMMLLLQRSLLQDQALKQLIDSQQTKGAANYHAWLTPEQFGAQFGPSDSDVQAVTDWLTRSGFQVANVAKGKSVIEFSGNAGQVRNAFHTEIHRFVVNDEDHIANVSDPAIPEALSPVVAGVVALNDFSRRSFVHKNGVYRRYKGSSELQPLFTYGNPANYAIGPGDFSTIYNIPPGATGAGQSIAVIAQTNINTEDVVNFRSMFGLPAYTSVCTSGLPPTCQFSVIINGTDPGIVGPNVTNCILSNDDEVEADLDTQWSGAVAPGANIYLVVSESTCSNPTQVSQGVDLSALYAVDNNIAPIITDSYGSCEAFLLTAGNQYYNALWAQAAAQGITVAVAAGDTGSAGCDSQATESAATNGVAVSGLASTPYNVAVAGTDFDPSTTNNSTYWKPSTSGDVINSALSYIPEITWNDSTCAFNYPTSACTSVDTSSGAADLTAAGGGLSNCILGTENNSGLITCGTGSPSANGGYAKPSYQTSLTPADSVRDLPDVSFFGSNGGPLPPTAASNVAYVICQSDTNPQNSATPTGVACDLNTPYQDFSLVGGTSAATPAFAGVMALVNQSTGQRQGNANYVLYNLAASDTTYYKAGKCLTSTGGSSGTPVMPNAACVFNDVNKGSNAVACAAGTPNCSNTATNTNGFGVLICTPNSTTNKGMACPNADNGNPAFQATTQYDLATGLGSINVGNLLNKWASANRGATTTTISNPTGGSPSGSNFTATISVSPTPPTGELVSFLALAQDQTTVLATFGPYKLSGGSVSANSNQLPPGTAYVEGTYGGDATLAASTSQPVALPGGTVTGANQNSTLTVYFVSLAFSNGVVTPSTPTKSSQNFTYGIEGYILQIVVTGSNSNGCSFTYPNTKPTSGPPCPTGKIHLFDGGNPLNDFVNGTTNTTAINNNGIVEDQAINLNVGSHTITATYDGDQNYTAATTSNSLSITLKQASTKTVVTSSLNSITSGETVTLTAVVGTQSNGVGPTGTVTFTSNGATLGAPTCTPTAATFTTPAFCTATLTTSISSLYPPPTGGPRTPTIPRIPLLVAFLSLLFFALGLRWIPQTRKRAYTYAGLLVIALLVGAVVGCGGGGGGGGGGGSTRNIGAAYAGDTNYTSSSGSTQIEIQ